MISASWYFLEGEDVLGRLPPHLIELGPGPWVVRQRVPVFRNVPDPSLEILGQVKRKLGGQAGAEFASGGESGPALVLGLGFLDQRLQRVNAAVVVGRNRRSA